VSLLDEQQSGPNPLIGDALAVFSAIGYGAYTVFIRKKIPDEKRVSMPMFFGFVGLFNVGLLWPFFIILHFSGVESVLPWPSWNVIAYLFINGILGTVLSDLLWSMVVLLTSSLVATMGLTLTVPMAIVSDLIFKQKFPTISYIGGSLLVVAGFALVNITTKEKEDLLLQSIKSKFLSLFKCNAHQYQTININSGTSAEKIVDTKA